MVLCGCMPGIGRAQTMDTTLQKENSAAVSQSCSGACCCAGNSQAPIGIMTDHIHNKGQWMFSYSYMNTTMRGNNMGTTHASDNDVYKKYMMAPERMNMQMHMVMAMYGVSDKLTVMAMGGFMTSNMSMNMNSGMTSMPGMVMNGSDMTMLSGSAGITDTRLSALYNFSANADRRIIGSLGINVPTGTIRATGTTMLGDDQRLPYDMQPGTGSFSVCPDITFAQRHTLLYWGANAGADIKLNYNSLGYRSGNTYHASLWAGYQFIQCLSATVRAEELHINTISGADAAMAIPVYQQNDPTTVTGNYGGTATNLYLGLNFHIMKPVLERFRVLAEYGMPAYQNLKGIQMSAKATVNAGLQYSL